jgi:Dam-replacing family
LAASNNPSLFLLNYDRKQLSVVNLMVVPKHFRSRNHRRTEALKANGAARRLDRLIYLARSGSDVR